MNNHWKIAKDVAKIIVSMLFEIIWLKNQSAKKPIHQRLLLNWRNNVMIIGKENIFRNTILKITLKLLYYFSLHEI